MEKATFAGGCFWGAEDTFRKIKGVTGTRVGYTGGSKENPDHIEVLSGKTGHVEAVEVTFDPAVVSFGELLAAFWKMHDPTLTRKELLRDIWDINDDSVLDNSPEYAGSHYRSAIFYHNEEQRQESIKSFDELQESIGRDKEVLTEIVPATVFYQAEDEHQQYLERSEGSKESCGCKTGTCSIE
jgi:peptide-methionine (S)-S-oxide reductase